MLHKQSGLTLIAIILIIAGVLIVAGGAWYLKYSSEILGPGTSPSNACTQEAKICHDGTSVGRTGPNCEFAPCPSSTSTAPQPTASTSNPPATIPNWETYRNKEYGFEVQHPPFLKGWENPKTPEVYLFSVYFENPLAEQSSIGKKIVFNITLFKDNSQLQDAFKLLTLEDKGKVMVGGYEAKKLFAAKGVAMQSTEATIYIIPAKNTALIFYGSDFSEISANDLTSILSNFKFTK